MSQYRSVLVVVQFLFHGPVAGARLGLVGRDVAPAVGAALAVAGLHELLKGGGELEAAFTGAGVGQPVAVAEAIDVALGDQTVEVLEADVGIYLEQTLQKGGVDLIAEAFSLEPEHHLEDLAAPIQCAEGLGLRRMHHFFHCASKESAPTRTTPVFGETAS